MKRLFLSLVIVLILVGCSTPRFMCYRDDGKQDKDQFRKDNYECALQSRTYYGGYGLGGLISAGMAYDQAGQIYKECMEIRGYIVKENTPNISKNER
jgi:hypothetical protein